MSEIAQLVAVWYGAVMACLWLAFGWAVTRTR